jgi:hypothetical protein
VLKEQEKAKYLINEYQPKVEGRAAYLTTDCPHWYDEVRDLAMDKVSKELDKGKKPASKAIRTYTYHAFIEILRSKLKLRTETFLIKQNEITDWGDLCVTLSPERVKEINRLEWTRSYMLNDDEQENISYEDFYEELNNCPNNERIFKHMEEQIPRKLIQDRFWKLQKDEDYLDWEVFPEKEFNYDELDQINTRSYNFNLAWCNRILLDHVFNTNILKRFAIFSIIMINIEQYRPIADPKDVSGKEPIEIKTAKGLVSQPDNASKIRAELDKLDEEEAKIIDLKHEEKYSYNKVAEEIGRTEDYVKKKLAIIKGKLKKIKEEILT